MPKTHHFREYWVLKAPVEKGYFAGFDIGVEPINKGLKDAVQYISYGNAETIRRIYRTALRHYEIIHITNE